MKPGQVFDKTWRVCNSGTVAWQDRQLDGKDRSPGRALSPRCGSWTFPIPSRASGRDHGPAQGPTYDVRHRVLQDGRCRQGRLCFPDSYQLGLDVLVRVEGQRPAVEELPRLTAVFTRTSQSVATNTIDRRVIIPWTKSIKEVWSHGQGNGVGRRFDCPASFPRMNSEHGRRSLAGDSGLESLTPMESWSRAVPAPTQALWVAKRSTGENLGREPSGDSKRRDSGILSNLTQGLEG